MWQPADSRRVVGRPMGGAKKGLINLRRRSPHGPRDDRIPFSHATIRRMKGDLLFAKPADAHALMRLCDDALLSRIELFEPWESDVRDACLRECARRGGQHIAASLAGMERG